MPVPDFYEGNGQLVDISMGFSDTDMKVETRAMLNDNQEREVYDLYVLAFKLESQDDPNPKVMNEKRYFSNEELYPATAEPNHYNAGKVMLPGLPTGTYIIAAVANVTRNDFDQRNIMTQLNAVTDFSEFTDIQLSFTGQASLTRNYMMMSGYYAAPGDPEHGADVDKVFVKAGGELPGYIHLRRVDARLHFLIRNGVPADANCTRFRINSYQIVNIPNNTSIIENPTDHSDSFTSTPELVSGWTATRGTTAELMNEYELDFYMLENRGPAKNNISTYQERSMEEKKPTERWDEDRQQYYSEHFTNPDGTRDWSHFINAPDNAAFIILNAEFHFTHTDEHGDSYIRIVESQYVVHLGYCEGATVAEKAKDFNTRRNTRYNYTITIKGADDIVVEAAADELYGDGLNHSTEGTVIDLDDNGLFIDMDAHYGVFNLEISRAEIERMELFISSPYGTWTSAGNHPADYYDYYEHPENYEPYPNYLTEDYQHIRIAYNAAGTSQLKAGQPVTSLVSYSETYDYDAEHGIEGTRHTLIPVHHEKKQIKNSTHTVPIYDILHLQAFYGQPKTADNPLGYTDENKDEQLVFTVFVNELYYYYPDSRINHDEGYDADGNIIGEPKCDYTMWTKFTNYTPGRTYMFLTTFYDSLDSDSHHVKCKLQIRQRCIETFFGEHILDGYTPESPDLPSAMGLEQINEHHYKNFSQSQWVGAGFGTPGNTNSVVNKDDGWWRTQYWQTHPNFNSWSRHVNQNVVMGSEDGHVYPTFQTIALQDLQGSTHRAQDVSYKTFATDHKNYEVADVAMNRNRDLNRDGIITQDEVRWFAPSSIQYVMFTVSAGGFQAPLFNKNDFVEGERYWAAWPIDDNYKKVYYNGIFHYLGIDWWYVITEEGASTGRSDTMGDGVGQDALNTQRSGEVRCARYLGVKDGDNGYNNINLPEPVTVNWENNVFNTIRYAHRMRRSPVSTPLRTHDNLSVGRNGLNAVADYFQMATTNCAPLGTQNRESQGKDPMQTLYDRMDGNYFCQNYEDPVYGGRGTWRIPNQMELAIMVSYTDDRQLHLGSASPSAEHPHLLSCTYWYRNEELTSNYEGDVKNYAGKPMYRHYLGARYDTEGGGSRKLAMIHSQKLYQDGWYSVRCVRDTDAEGNFVGGAGYGREMEFTHGEITYRILEGAIEYTVQAEVDPNASVEQVIMNGVEATIRREGNTAYATAVIPYSGTNQIAVEWKLGFYEPENIQVRKKTYTVDLPSLDFRFVNLEYTDDGISDSITYTSYVTMNSAAVLTGVTIDGVPAQITPGILGAFSATATAPVDDSHVTVVWTGRYLGSDFTQTKVYDLKPRYYVFANKRASATRYAYINTNEVSVLDGSNNPVGSNIEALEAQYKWKLVASTTDLTNVTDIRDEVVYYLYNAGYKAFLCEPSNMGAQANTLPISGTPARIKIITVVQNGVTYRTMYMIDGSGNRRGWINFLGSGFGYWVNSGDQRNDDGNKWIFNGAMFPGQMPLYFNFADNYTVSGSTYSVSVETNPEVVVNSVTIGGLAATVTGSDGHFTATVTGTLPSGPSFETVWNIRKGSDTFVKRHTYNRPIKYYVISSEAGPQQYAYADGSTNRTAADAAPYTGAVENLDANHQWIFTTTKTAVGVEPVNANVFGTSTAYYLYNKGTGKYINGPLNTSEYGYLTIGEAQDRMRVKVETRGSRYSFLFSESGISNHCASIYRRNGGGWAEDPAVFGIFQTGNRDRTPCRFNLIPVYE